MFLKHNLPAILWALVILILTLMPGKYIPPAGFFEIFHPDKLVHVAIFAVLIALCLHGFLKQETFSLLRLHPMVIAFSGCVLYGLLLEAMQGTLLADRYFEWMDAAANTAGCAVGAGLFRYFKRTISGRLR